MTDVPGVRARQGGEPQEPNANPFENLLCTYVSMYYSSGCMFEEMSISDEINIIIVIYVFMHKHFICGYTSSPWHKQDL